MHLEDQNPKDMKWLIENKYPKGNAKNQLRTEPCTRETECLSFRRYSLVLFSKLHRYFKISLFWGLLFGDGSTEVLDYWIVDASGD